MTSVLATAASPALDHDQRTRSFVSSLKKILEKNINLVYADVAVGKLSMFEAGHLGSQSTVQHTISVGGSERPLLPPSLGRLQTLTHTTPSTSKRGSFNIFSRDTKGALACGIVTSVGRADDFEQSAFDLLGHIFGNLGLRDDIEAFRLVDHDLWSEHQLTHTENPQHDHLSRMLGNAFVLQKIPAAEDPSWNAVHRASRALGRAVRVCRRDVYLCGVLVATFVLLQSDPDVLERQFDTAFAGQYAAAMNKKNGGVIEVKRQLKLYLDGYVSDQSFQGNFYELNIPGLMLAIKRVGPAVEVD